MNELIYHQINILAIFILTGMCIGILFDFFRIQRRVLKTHDFVTYIQDILFWFISGIILIFVFMRYTNGEIRAYMLSGMILGLIIYFKLISKFVIKINTSILSLIMKFIGILLWPLKKIIEIIKKSWKKNNNML